MTYQGPHLVVHSEGGGGVGRRVTPVGTTETREILPPVKRGLPHLCIQSFSGVILVFALMHFVLNELLFLHGLLPRVGHPQSVLRVDLEVAILTDPVMQGNVLVTEVLLRTSYPPVDDDQDEEEDQHEENAADESDEPGLSGELLHAESLPGVGQDHVDDVLRVHLEHQGGGERTVAQLGEGCCPDDVGLVEGEVGQGDGGGGGVQPQVGVDDGAVGLHPDVVSEQLAVPVLRRGRGERQPGAGAVQHLHPHLGGRGGGHVLQRLNVHRVGGLTLQHLVERHQEELVLSGLPEVRYDNTVGVLTLQNCHDIKFLTPA